MLKYKYLNEIVTVEKVIMHREIYKGKYIGEQYVLLSNGKEIRKSVFHAKAEVIKGKKK